MEFNIKPILTVITGVAFERGLGSAKELLEFMTGEPATEFTFLEGSRPKICTDAILEVYPGLEKFLLAEINSDTYLSVLDEAIAEFGETLEIQPIENMPSPAEYLGLV